MSSEDNENPWGDPGTAGTKPEYSCPSGAQQSFAQNIWCQEWAANYQMSVSWDPEGSFSPPSPTQPLDQSKVRHDILLRAGDLQPQILI